MLAVMGKVKMIENLLTCFIDLWVMPKFVMINNTKFNNSFKGGHDFYL